MPRVTITPKDTPGSYPATPLAVDSADFAWTVGDPPNDHQFKVTGKEFVLVRNTGAGAQTVTFVSTADPFKRKDDIAYSIGAGEFACFGPFLPEGWAQTDGFLHIDIASADLQFAVLRFP